MNMPRLNQNQRIQALTMLARGDNVSNVSIAFGCNRNTIMGWQIAVDQLDRGLQTLGTGRFVMLTHLRRVFKRRQVLQGSTVSANRQCGATSDKPGNPFGQGGPMWDKCLQHVIGLPVCSGKMTFPLGATAMGSG